MDGATYTWTGAGFFGQDYLWSNDFNWAGGVAPSAGEANVTIVFPNNASPKVTTNDIVGLAAGAIQFQGTNYVVHGKPAGNALTLYGTGLGGWAMIASGNGNYFAGTSPLVLSNYGVVGVASGCTLSVLSSIGGTNGFLKASPGTLKLAAGAANTYTGTTTVSDGTLDLNNGTSSVNTFLAIAGPLVIGNTNPAYSPRVRLLLDDQIANTQPVTVRYNGEFWLNGHNDTIGSLTLEGGADVSTGVGGGFSSPGLLTLNGNLTNLVSVDNTYPIINGLLDLGLFTRTFRVESSLQINADISGSSIFNPGITKTGGGALHFTSTDNTYSGPTSVDEGSLVLMYGATPGNTNAGTTVAAGGRLELYSSGINNESLVLNGQSNLTTLIFTLTNSWNGPVTLNGPCTVRDYTDPGDPEYHMTFSGAISGTGSLRKIGYGRLHFTGFGGNTFGGGLFCEEGFTFLDKSASAPALSGPLVVGRVGEPGQYIFVEVMQHNQIPNNVPIKLIDYGSLSAETGANDTLGPIEFAGGLLVGSGGVITLAGDVTNRVTTVPTAGIYGDVSLSGTRIFHCDTNSSLSVASSLAGSGGITKTGPGELNLYGACTYSGATTVKEGTLKLTANGRPGSSAAGTTIEANGALYLDGASVTNESLVLYGGGSDGVALIHHNTNVWSGPVEIHSGASIMAEPVAKLSIIGAIIGDGGLTHYGDGMLIFGGNTDNTFDGPTYFRIGTLQLAKTGAFAIPHALWVGYSTGGPPATVKAMAANQFAPAFGAELISGGVTLYPSTALDCNGFDQTVANLNLYDAQAMSGAGLLTMPGNLNVSRVNGGNSYLFGNLRLASGISANHIFNVASNTVLWSTATVTESGTQNIYKDGRGHVLNAGTLNFNGTLTLNQGRWYTSGAMPFGSAVGGTFVNAGASLITSDGAFGEPLTLAGSGDAGAGALFSASTNSFTSSVTLTSDAVIFTETNGVLTLSGAVSGAGGLTKSGGGTLKFLGASANTYTGATLVNGGKLELGKTSGVAVPGPLTITGPNSSTYARLLQPEQIANTAPVVLQDTGWIALEGNNETIGSLAGVGAVYQSAGQTGLLTVGGDGSSATFDGIIHGGGGLAKTGAGTFTLTGNNLYTGTTTVNGGTLMIFGQQPQSPVSILTGGTLGGTGKVGNISDLNGHVSPGASPGILVCSNFSTFTPANLCQMEIAGATPGTGHDQLQVNGSILLMGGTLQVAMNFPGAISNQYVIVSNDGVDLISGAFTGLPEGASLTNSGAVFVITYHGGDGNDIMLVQQNVAATSQINTVTQLGNGSLQFTANAAPNLTYSVEAATNLVPPVAWTVIGNATANGGGALQFTDPDAPQFPVRFYRLRHP